MSGRTAAGTVAVISGSISDKQIVEQATGMLDQLGVKYEVKVLSAHRNPEGLRRFVEGSNADIFIAIAGMAAHLPGVIASLTVKPVIGVPVSGKLGGLDALLSIVQMPSGIPVASVAVDSGKNAGLLAAEILALKDQGLKEKLLEYRRKLAEG
ncbi:MAG: 5-(carboxyamino)imidazole ribonucleotide mutase [Thaumarchaeota archaeon]|nr:5-(carboxyamino)imidazole ribonucleotide mutase [Nitrososphaerota archaeon]